MKSAESLITVGRIVESRGIRGQVVVYPLSDDPARFRTFDHVLAIESTGATRKLEIEQVEIRSRHHRQEVLLNFAGIDSRDASDTLKGSTLLVDREALALEDDEYFLFDLVGFSVHTEDGTKVGSVTEVRRMPAQDLFVIASESNGEVLIPDVPEFVDKSHLDERRLVLRPIEGLLDIS